MINTEIETMAFYDIGYNLSGHNYLNYEWIKYFQGNQQVYNKLRQIKTDFDPNNIFQEPLIPPFETVVNVAQITDDNGLSQNDYNNHDNGVFRHEIQFIFMILIIICIIIHQLLNVGN